MTASGNKNPDSLAAFAEEVAASVAAGTFVRLMLSSAVQNSPDTAGKILGRLVVIKGVPHLSLTLRYPMRDLTKNIPAAEAAAWVHEQLAAHYRSALLGTTKTDWQFISKVDGSVRLISHKAAIKTVPARAHDQSKSTLLDASANDWLRGLGVLDNDGKLRASMADKHRQICHYLEILSHLTKDCDWTERVGDKMLLLADMGCGKGYLTFGAWQLFRRVYKTPVRVLGVETRPDLVAATDKLARQIKADGLEFMAGEIDSVKLPPVDALIALHACNTATDDAIRRGIELGAKLIIVAPCCHKELRPQLAQPEPLAAVLRHGVMAERMAEWTTDGLRALFLEWAGYRTKLMEFVASEHTPKNLMLAAIREREPFTDAGAKQRIVDLKNFFGVKKHALDVLLK